MADLGSKTILEAFHAQCTRTPDKLLYVFVDDQGRDQEQLTYRQTATAAARIAGFLTQTCGLQPGDRVLLVYPPSLEFVKALLGCLVTGLIAVPIYPPNPLTPTDDLARFATLAEAAGATAVLTSRKYARTRQTATVKHFFAHPPTPWPEIPWFTTDKIEAAEFNNLTPYRPKPDDIALLQFTSGSTSAPKGVMITHANLTHQLAVNAQELDLNLDSISVLWVPQYHDFGLISGILSAIRGNGLLYLMSPVTFIKKPALWFEVMSRVQATHTAAPNFAYELAVRKTTPQQRRQWDLSSLRIMMNAAEPIRATTISNFLDAFAVCQLNPEAFCPAYGLAEHTVGVSVRGKAVLGVDQEILKRDGTIKPLDNQSGGNGTGRTATVLIGCGRPSAGVQLRFVNPETRLPCQPMEVGEIWVDSPSKAAGYYGLVQETREGFQARLQTESDPAEYLRTGDLGFLYQGELFITGRLKDLVIIRGRNYYPQDIELTAEESHPALRAGRAAAFSVESEGEEQLVIVQEVKPVYVRQLEAEAVIGAIRQAVASRHQLVPQAVVLLKPGAIPKTSSGKIKRQACRRMFLSGELKLLGQHTLHQSSLPPNAARQNSPADDDPLAVSVLDVLSCLVSERGGNIVVTPDSHLVAEIGLDSLSRVELIARLERAFALKLDEALLLSCKTVRDVIDRIRTAKRTLAEEGAVQPAGLDFLNEGETAPIPRPRNFLLHTALIAFKKFSQLVWQLEANGLEHIPPDGPFIVCPNHESHLDIFWVASFLNASSQHELCCFAKLEHFQRIYTRWVTILARAIPADRHGNILPALRAGLKLLRAGRPLLIHPEGTRTRSGELLPFLRGPAKLACATKAPIIPVRIKGAYAIYPTQRLLPSFFDWRRLRRRKLHLYFGRPIYPAQQEQGWQAETYLTQQLRQAVLELGDNG